MFSSSLTAISFLSLVHIVQLLLSVSNVWIIMIVHRSILLLSLCYHVTWAAASWLFLYYFWRVWSHVLTITWVWNLYVVTIVALVLLEGLRMSWALAESVVLRIVVHDHFWLQRLVNDVWIVSLTRETATDIALEGLVHEGLWAKIWAWWNLLLAVDLTARWRNWSSSTHASRILSKRFVLWASSVASHSWIHGAEWSSVSIVDHAISMSLAAQSVLIISTVATHHIVLLLCLFDKVVILLLWWIKSSSIRNTTWRMSYLSLLICCWDLVVLIRNHTFHVLCNDVILTYHRLLLVWLLACHCATFTSERVLLSALRMLVWIWKVSIESVLMRSSSHT